MKTTPWLKQRVRHKICAQRALLSASEIETKSRRICQNILPLPDFQNAKEIALYAAFSGEVDCHLLFEAALSANKNCYFPVLAHQQLHFIQVDDQTPLATNRFGILEPAFESKRLIQPTLLDCVIVPLVAFDKACRRLGMGKGYYDRTFHFKAQNTRPTLIGVAYEFQKLLKVPCSTFDVPLDKVITEKKIYLKT